ncbi:hypothetical protein HELRODRAFT_102301 [Helobdella robusta]|uniref:DM10 domain-containing protein n=1 Tax=Helobdella robusta TaxID=6412 RepID=T1ED93_HELRO|nr:hypothetical protein HELRODRAFT_102301 [Helobdella robusta]ESN96853.1 hypothetical protein HELRODRAFT_102301 [Helobdella robusta]
MNSKLPFLPGNQHFDFAKSNYHRSHTLGFNNGYAVQKKPDLDTGGSPLQTNQIHELISVNNYNPQLYYGQSKPAPPQPFMPSFVALDKKVLSFKAWFKETVAESPNENYRIRKVQIYYYLEDGTMVVNEPVVANSGLNQGKMIKRQKIPKNNEGGSYTWKDLNNGRNINCFGRVFHIYDCDAWTTEYLESEGIEVNPAEQCPDDPYIMSRETSDVMKSKSFINPPSNHLESLKRFLDLDRKVLRFFCIGDDQRASSKERRKFILHYYLVNDTVEVREVHTKNDGHDPFSVLISRQRIPKNRNSVDSNFPSIVLELTENEIHDYFSPKDFAIGRTILLYNRPFLIYDCDDFTKAFYWKNYGLTDFTPYSEELHHRKKYTGYGTLEDSLQSVEKLVLEPPKKDLIKMMNWDGVVLRYEAKMEAMKSEFTRRFIISYRLADDTITIYEPPVKNSGIQGGKFLEKSRVAKPGSTTDRPVYYGPQDFYVGAVIDVFRHRFIITGADDFAIKFMESRSNIFNSKSLLAHNFIP